ncbi:MAG TPA: DNA repair protein RecO [Armatimonadota bacterium]|jgi:DNA repair protein RecO (recombination protein O)
MASRVYRANAIVLRRINLAETDKIVTLFTREKGKLGAVAKGARRPASRLAGATELFGYVRVLLAVGQSLDVITQVEVRKSFPDIRRNLDKIAAASYMTELADIFTDERHPNPDLFDLLLSALHVLNTQSDVALLATAFSLQTLSEAGYHPSFDVCARCGGADTEFTGFSPTAGGAICRSCRMSVKDAFAAAPESLDAARSLLTWELPQAARLELTPRARVQALRMARAFLLLRAERPLKSARFLDELLAARKLAEGEE